ncbi:Arylsulfatase A [Neorhodopirellula lusitana]|uniref:Arylsulfatase A n=1 Tax=Neorhodopirellula lusitana TaxID=445327 RepID=A0ABY1Q1L6_9BACT|nr:arylsulfatase [Neorhodopirellula lusitana]SMP54190.1 Arylsulfatase A [Neorhodopirellula lusitana]
MKTFFHPLLPAPALLCLIGIATLAAPPATANDPTRKPNIVYILADDLGYGDVHCLNPERCKITTPHMDQLAADGIIFTDAHSSSSVCTPTRYSILTGRYNWRSKKQGGVLHGFDQPLIAPDRVTVAGFLKEQGYNTACIGKWHLGLGLPTIDGKATRGKNADNVDWRGRINGGPVDLGFDYYCGISASLDMPPYIFIENDHFVGEATATKEFHPRRVGPAHPDLEAVDVLPEISRQTVQYIQRQQADNPFFMYVALTSPHTPLVPSKEWQGKSQLGTYGDFVMQTDAIIGEITTAVDASRFAENTMIIVTSDNGCSAKPAKASELQKAGHYPSGEFRGYKSDLWDGGHRVPFIVRWPAGVEAGSVSDQTICLTDLMATSAELAGSSMPQSIGEDSVSFAPALKGKPIVSSRQGVIHHSISGRFAYRQGKWKLLLTAGSGGWTKEKMPPGTTRQLYDMEADPGEQVNLYAKHPEVAQRLLAQLQSDVRRGRSTDGPDLSNDVQVKLKAR